MTGEGWLVALDIDGTVILEDETMGPGAPEAVARLTAEGHEVMLATGRSWSTVGQFLDALEITPEFVVCSNGAVIMRRTDEGYVRWQVETFDASKVLTLLRGHLPDARYMVELASGARLFTSDIGGWSLEGATQVSFEELSAQPVSRVVVVSPDHDEDDFHRLVAEAGLNEVSYAVGWTAWLDIAPLGVDKGTALEYVRAELDVPADRILVAGDGRNDVGMFSWALAGGGRAVAMGQAVDEVKAAAGEVTDAVEDGGLARALSTIPAPAQGLSR